MRGKRTVGKDQDEGKRIRKDEEEKQKNYWIKRRKIAGKGEKGRRRRRSVTKEEMVEGEEVGACVRGNYRP